MDTLETDAAHALPNLVLAVWTLWPLAGDDNPEHCILRLTAAEPYLRLFDIDATGQSELSVLGPVNTNQGISDQCEMNEEHENAIEFVESGEDAAKALQV